MARVKPAALKHRLKTTARTRITPGQMRTLCDAPNPQTLRGCRDRALLATLATSGCRVAEVVALTTAQLHVYAGAAFLEVCGKHQTEARHTPLSQEASTCIAAWLAQRPLQSPVLFTRFAGCVPPSTHVLTQAFDGLSL